MKTFVTTAAALCILVGSSSARSNSRQLDDGGEEHSSIDDELFFRGVEGDDEDIIQGSLKNEDDVRNEIIMEAKHRQRRFLIPSQSGWVVTASLFLKIPIQDLGSTLTFSLPLVYNFDSASFVRRKKRSLPQLPVIESGPLKNGKSLPNEDLADVIEDHETEDVEEDEVESHLEDQRRQEVIPAMASALGHACVLRSLCEVEMVPDHGDGLIGEFLNAMLKSKLSTAALRRRAFEAGDEYAKAQWTGRVEEDCSAYHRRCDMDLFEIFDPFSSEIGIIDELQRKGENLLKNSTIFSTLSSEEEEDSGKRMIIDQMKESLHKIDPLSSSSKDSS